MRQELKTDAFIFKRQSLGEADELLTLYTRGLGKVRAVAQSIKRPQSKLVYGLQSAALVNVTIMQKSGLAKIIHASTSRIYQSILAEQTKMAAWYIAVEIGLKATPDEEPNQGLFNIFQQFWNFIDTNSQTELSVSQSLINFKIQTLAQIGHMINEPQTLGQGVYFSNSLGGFTSERPIDAIAVTPELFHAYKQLQLKGYGNWADATVVQHIGQLVNSFLEYILERELKTERLLSQKTL